MTLIVEDLTVYRGDRPVVDHVSFGAEGGEFVGLIGPNGAGKTTLMRAALGLLAASGRSTLTELAPSARAKAASWMPQQRDIAWPVSVETLVSLGRTPYLPAGGRLSAADQFAIDDAIARMGLDGFRKRIATQLSGGEQARVLIARALAQDTPLLMADEPIAGLDPASQISTMQLFGDLAAGGKTVIASLHDLGLATRHCTRLVLLGQGKLVADGRPTDVLTPENLAAVFGVSAYFADTPHGPIFQPLEVL